MPKVTPYGAQDKLDAKKREVCNSILAAIRSRAALMGVEQKKEVAAKCGVHPNTWRRWNDTALQTAGFWEVLDAAQKMGVKVSITVDAATERKEYKLWQ